LTDRADFDMGKHVIQLKKEDKNLLKEGIKL